MGARWAAGWKRRRNPSIRPWARACLEQPDRLSHARNRRPMAGARPAATRNVDASSPRPPLIRRLPSSHDDPHFTAPPWGRRARSSTVHLAGNESPDVDPCAGPPPPRCCYLMTAAACLLACFLGTARCQQDVPPTAGKLPTAVASAPLLDYSTVGVSGALESLQMAGLGDRKWLAPVLGHTVQYHRPGAGCERAAFLCREHVPWLVRSCSTVGVCCCSAREF